MNKNFLVKEKLSNRINTDGQLYIKSQTHRTQLANKDEVIEKINELLQKALVKKKKRIATKPSKLAKEKRIESKKQTGQLKEARKKIRHHDI